MTGPSKLGEKALAANADNPVLAYNNLKASEGKNDPDGVIKWSAETSRLARKTIDSAGTSGGADAKGRAEYAQQLDSYSEIRFMRSRSKQPILRK